MGKVHKTIAEAKDNLRTAAPLVGPRYKLATGRADWEGPASTPESQANYEAGIAESNAAGRRIAKVREAGNAKFVKGCAEKGALVIGARITAAIEDYGREFSPILSAMNAASDAAPARTRDFRTNVTNRLLPVVEAAKKAAGKPV